MSRERPQASVRAAVVSATYSTDEDNPVANVLSLVGSRSELPKRDSDGDCSDAVIVVPLDSAAMPHPVVLHNVVDVLVELGWTVTVGASLSPRSTDRGVTRVDDALAATGYVGITERGNSYIGIDLSRDTCPAPCPPSSVLSGQGVSAAWSRGALRLLVARWTDDPHETFRGCVSAVLGCASVIPGAKPADVAADLVMHLPPTFAIIESPGADEDRHTLIASDDVVLTDVVAAVLHGEDPTRSPLLDRCVQAGTLPPAYTIVGDVEPPAIRPRANQSVTDALRRLDQAMPDAGRVMRILMSDNGDREADEVLAWLQRRIGPVVDPDSASSPAAVAMISNGLAAAGESVAAFRANFNKDNVRRVAVPLGFDPERFRAGDYRQIPDYLSRFTVLLDAAPLVDSWLHWCYFDRSVLFSVEHLAHAEYADWIARVDVAQGISMMADYLGGRIVPVSHDGRGRVTRQAERNIYLPQPNYLAFWGGKPIDVCKIELVEYRPDHCRLSWRTVLSPNGSAEYDDGMLTFADNGDGRTRITISGRQKFQLPPFWEAVDLDRYPEVKNPLVTDAYRRFFSSTFDNFEACYEGRPHQIGTDAVPASPILPTQAWSTYLGIAREWLDERRVTHDSDDVDKHGFRHFPGTTSTERQVDSKRWLDALRPLLHEYAAAVRSDMERVPRW
ncbi:hypothetical protein [Mycobacterium sp. OTB74]|jgi:hypothetical protein|uniref:hypothetical protein n=1 Tax=Mycobacterium sp. OTB74 TaxID=1853452 RepID=UPI002476F8F2|nr:hypothetical protein [Mycobacterium sp. OTB74]MDH6244435.1 hypothetical protein [Mycobacterium sp. OTB74]